MKKTYSKPDVLFESFALSTNIAAGCEEEPNNSSEGCGVLFGNFTVFNENMDDACDRHPPYSGTKYDEYCYHVPQSDLNIFFS